MNINEADTVAIKDSQAWSILHREMKREIEYIRDLLERADPTTVPKLQGKISALRDVIKDLK